jgi:hypothetical protein
MNQRDLLKLREDVATLVGQRQHLGGFDANAEAILALAQSLLAVVNHLVEVTKDGKK